MSTVRALDLPSSLSSGRAVIVADSMQVETKSRSHGAACLDCGTLSHRLHSHYVRKLADMPAHGRRVSLSMTVRRFRCTDKGCRRRTFVEPLGDSRLPTRGRRPG
ncbi:transposase [Gluconacetobacter liquefaciens]|uniref:Transposase n=2 Tax=Gluconacetobacter liquefaciens TaxID=89584 RepID=A0A7W4PB02_GLULI|nr:transposase [Gluconacetobacter liquefaciens]